MFKAGCIPASTRELFRRIFWKSEELALEAELFWQELKKRGGMPIKEWRKWVQRRNMSVGQYYNMLRKLIGAGFIEKRGGMWRISSNFLRELEQLIILYSAESGFEHRLRA